MDENKIKKEAKQILDKFAKALELVSSESDDSETSKFAVDREEFERVEGKAGTEVSSECENSFKDKLLENAPKKDDDFIIAEKGDWK